MNKERIKSLKNTVCYILAFLLATIGCFALLKVIRPKAPIHAANSDMISEVDISNGNFNESTRSSYPYDPSGFKSYAYNSELTSSSNANVKSGIVKLDDLDKEEFADKLTDASRKGAHDQYVLMIDSYDYDRDYAYNTNFGYRTSSPITLDANKNYMISVDAYTLENSNIASIYLYKDNEVFSSFKNVKSYKNWSTFYFYVQTNNVESLSLTLGMYLEGAGAVLFDNIACHEISTNLYNTYTASISQKERNVSMVNNVVSSYNVSTDSMFVNESSTKVSTDAIDHIYGKNGADYTTIGYKPDNDGSRNSALLVNNIKETYIRHATEDNFLTFKKAQLYKVTIRAKATDLSGNAYLKLTQTNTEDAINSEEISITSTSGYQNYSFFVNSHPTEDSTYRLEFALGSKDKLTSGKLYISNVTVSNIDYDTFSSSDSTKQINLAKSLIYSGSSIMLNNGTFDGLKINDYIKPYPATPIDWTVGLGKNTQHYGIVHSESNIFSTLKISKPFTTVENENLLLMYNTTNDTLTYKSTSKTITADSYHKFQINVKTINAPAKISLVSTKDTAEVILSTITIDSSKWQTATMFLHGGHQDLEVSLKIELTTTNGAGYLYLDDARFDYPDTSKSLKDQFVEASDADFTRVADLMNILDTKSTTPWAETNYFSTSGEGVVKYGIIPITDNDTALTDAVIDEDDLINFKKINTNVLGLKLNDGYQTISSNLGFALKSDESSFYRISVSVFTKNLTSQVNEETNTLRLVDISLTGFEDKFENISSNGEWTEYTFYIDPSSATTSYLNINVGDSSQLCTGLVFVGDIQFELITDEIYTQNAVAGDYVKVLETVVDPEDDKTEDTNTDSTPTVNSNWIFYIPSILFVIAILVAIIGVMARKIKWKKPSKKSKNSYDRNATVSRQVYERKATTIRENRLMELNKDLAKLTEERAEFEASYKQNLAKLREMKIKRANATDIAKLEKDMKRAQKQASSIGIAINEIEMQIKYTKSDSYISSLMKKLARERIIELQDDQESK